jgi:hypothetical protein
MTKRTVPVAAIAFSMTLGNAAVGLPQRTAGSWLDDAAPRSWNRPGAAIPAAPKVEESPDRRCRGTARPPQLPEDRRLRDRGWDLVGPYQGGWDMLVITGTASYDGMCRPRQYQEFVFVRGVFVGTLSPQPMDSRTDGALSRTYLQGPGTLLVEYARYTPTDPLCCPSRTSSVEFEVAGNGRVVRATRGAP